MKWYIQFDRTCITPGFWINTC